ncbi:hypothetical protein BST61_g2971 [Cercospora zeina]
MDYDYGRHCRRVQRDLKAGCRSISDQVSRWPGWSMRLLQNNILATGPYRNAHRIVVAELLQQGHEYDTRLLTVDATIRARFAGALVCSDLRDRVKRIPDTKVLRPIRNLALLASLWSPSLVRYYDWQHAGKKYLRLLREAAELHSNFRQDFVPRANAVLIERHESAIRNNKVKSVQEDDKTCLLEQQDLRNIVAGKIPDNGDREQLWTTSTNTTFYISSKRLLDWRGDKAYLYLLQYDNNGLVTKREPSIRLPTPSSPSSAAEVTNASEASETEEAHEGKDDQGHSSELDDDVPGEHNGSANNNSGPEELDRSGASSTSDTTDDAANAREEQEQELGASASPLTDQNNCSFSRDTERDYIVVSQDLINAYMATLDATATQQTHPLHNLRRQWLSTTTRWAKIYAYSGKYRSGVGMATCIEETEVLYFSADDFCSFAASGRRLEYPVLIREHFTDTGMHTLDTYAQLLRDGYSNQNIAIRSSKTITAEDRPVAWFCDQITSLATSISAGTNALNLQGIANAHRPTFTYLPRYQLMRSLCAQRGSLGKATSARASDVTSCDCFDILGLPGAFSGAHVDALTGTWLRNLTGIKLWMIVPQKQMDGEWDVFAQDGPLYEPNGKERLILLEQDDVLFMPPGLAVVHAVHTVETSLMEGGMLWDYHSIVATLQAVHWIATHQNATNEALPWELPAILAALEERVKGDGIRFATCGQLNKFRAEFQSAALQLKALGCDCSRCDFDGCICRIALRRCTQWCHGHEELPNTSHNCMHEQEAPYSSDEGNANDGESSHRKRRKRRRRK